MRKRFLQALFIACGLTLFPYLAPPSWAGPGAVVALGIIASSVIGKIVIGAIISTGLSLLASALLAKPKTSPTKESTGSDSFYPTQINIRQAAAPRQVIYGRTRVSGVIVFADTSNSNLWMNYIIALSTHEIDAFEQMWIDDEVHYLPDAVPVGGLPAGTYELTPGGGFTPEGYFTSGGKTVFNGESLIYCQFHLGTPTQAADDGAIASMAPPFGSGDNWGSTDQMKGMAYVYVRIQKGGGGGNPRSTLDSIPEFSFVVRGHNKIWDPRDETYKYTPNSALCAANFINDTYYGMGFPTDSVDQDILAASANICEEEVDHGTFLWQRYQTNGAFTTDLDSQEVLGRLLAAMQGKAPYDGDKWRILAGAYYASSFTIYDTDLAAGPTIQTLISKREMFNSIKGTYLSANHGFHQTDFQPISSAAFVAEDNDFEIWQDISLPFTIHDACAQQLAKIELELSRRQFGVLFPGKLRLWNVHAGDTVTWDSDLLGIVQTFEVKNVRLIVDGTNNTITVELELIETSADFWEWTEEDVIVGEDPGTGTSDPDIATVIPPTGVSATEVLVERAPGAGLRSDLVIEWVYSVDALVIGYQVEYRLNGATDWIVAPRVYNSNTYTITDLDAGTYNVRVAAVNGVGNYSTFVAPSNPVVSGDTTVPSTPAGLVVVTSAAGWATLRWTASTEERVRNTGFVEIRYQNVTSGATWASATVIAVLAGNSDTYVVRATIGTYLIKFKSATGVYSAAADTEVLSTLASAVAGVEILGALPSTDLYDGRTVYLTTDGKIYRYDLGTGWTASTATSDLTGTLPSTIFPSTLRPIEVVDALPSTGNFRGRIIYLTSDGKIYRWNSDTTTGTSFWVATVPTTDLTGTLASTLFSSTIRPVEVVDALPSTGNFRGRVIYLTSDGKLYRWNSDTTTGTSFWVATVPTTDLTGTLSSTLFSSTIRPVEVVGALPSTGNFLGRIIFLTTDGKIYRWTDSSTTGTTFWTAVVPASDLTGTLGSTLFPSTLRPVEVVGALPSSGNFQGRTIFLTTDGKLYRWTDTSTTGTTFWTAAVPTTDLTGTITTTQIADDSISTPKLQANSITAAKIGAGEVTAGKIATDAVTAGTIAAGAVTTSKLASKSITADKIAIGDSDNRAANGDFAQGATGWGTWSGTTYTPTPPTNTAITASSGYNSSGFHLLISAGATTSNIVQNANMFQVIPGETYYLGAVVQAVTSPAQSLLVRVRFFDSAGSPVAHAGTNSITFTAADTTYTLGTRALASSADVVVPPGAIYGCVEVVMNTGPLTGGSYRVGQVVCLRRNSGNLIVDGTITTGKIAAGAITANEIAADTITAGQIAAGAISSSELSAGAVVAGKIAAGAVTAGTIAAGAIVAADIAADTITAGQIAAGAISSSELAASSVIAGKIATDAVTAGTIATDAVTAGKIQAGAVSTDKLAARSISASKMVMQDLDNRAENGDFGLGNTAWGTWSGSTYTASLPAGYTITAGSGYNGSGYHLLVSGASSAVTAQNVSLFPVIPGNVYFLSAVVLRNSTPSQSLQIKLAFYDGSMNVVAPALSTSGTLTFSSTDPTSYTEKKIASSAVIVPASAVYGLVEIKIVSGTLASGTYQIGAIYVAKRDAADLTIDGSLTADKIAAGSITANRLVIGDFINRVENGGVVSGALGWGTWAGNTATVTMTIASPCVVTWTAHGLVAGTPVRFTTTGALPTGVTSGTIYYVSSASLATDTFRIAATQADAVAGTNSINSSGSQSGTHTAADLAPKTYSSSMPSTNTVVTAGTGYLGSGYHVLFNTSATGSDVVQNSNKFTVTPGETYALRGNAQKVTAPSLDLVVKLAFYDANNVEVAGSTNTLTWTSAGTTVTITIATPGVVTWTAHGLVAGAAVKFATSGSLPTGITAGTTYYVATTSLTADSFKLSDTEAHALAGTNIVNTSGSQSGTHTGTAISYQEKAVASTATVVPTSAVYALVQASLSSGTLSGGTWRLGLVHVARRNGGDLIIDGAITAQKISVTALSAISADLGIVTAGTIYGNTIQTANSTTRVEMTGTNNDLRVYISGTEVVRLGGTVGSGLFQVVASAPSWYPVYFQNTSTSGGPLGHGLGAVNALSLGAWTIYANSLGTAGGDWAMRAYSSTGPTGELLMGGSSGSGGWAAYSNSGGYGPFTGAHDGLIALDDEPEQGDILVDVDVIIGTISDIMTSVTRSSQANQKGVIGVFVQRYDAVYGTAPASMLEVVEIDGKNERQPRTMWAALCETHDLVAMNALGEGEVNVCGENGNIAKGDLIVTSSTPGKGMRQDDDIIRSYTVARARQAVTFSTPGEVKRCACIYLCG